MEVATRADRMFNVAWLTTGIAEARVFITKCRVVPDRRQYCIVLDSLS